ncbi:MAG: hypothetical protein ACE5FC_04020 [Myxococcota bacterium]
MRDFSFRFITGAILAFVFLYIFSLKGGEALIAGRVTHAVRQAVTVDPENLLAGKVSYADLIHDRVRGALAQGWILTLRKLGVDLKIVVQTGDGFTLYPRVREWFSPDALSGPGLPGLPLSAESVGSRTPAETAQENFRLMRQGLALDIRAVIGNNTWLANGILILYLFALLQVLWYHARRFVLRTEQEKLEIAERLDRESAERVARIESELKRVTGKLNEASRRASERVTRIRALESEKAELEEKLGGWSWEDATELEKEMENLEAQLAEAKAEKKQHELKIEEISSRAQKRQAPSVPRGKAREADLIEKRFKMLYKNLEFEHRVIADLFNLGDDDAMVRAEEIIKRLNDRDENLPMRRKVGGLERGNIFELGFGSKGRIYCCHGEGGKMRVVLIGAKNTQDKDLSYLRRYR